jgi:hypothetical protein
MIVSPMNPHKHKKLKKNTIIEISLIKINLKIENQHNKFQSQQSNQQMLLTRRNNPNTTKINNNI